MTKFLCQCDGNGLFFDAVRFRCFLDKRYHRYRCDYLDLTIVDNVFRCHRFSRFLVGFHDFVRYLTGFNGISWFLVGWLVVFFEFSIVKDAIFC